MVADSTTDTRPIVLTGDRLKVEIARPGEFYNGTRFDWSGHITQVTLDGQPVADFKSQKVRLYDLEKELAAAVCAMNSALKNRLVTMKHPWVVLFLNWALAC